MSMQLLEAFKNELFLNDLDLILLLQNRFLVVGNVIQIHSLKINHCQHYCLTFTSIEQNLKLVCFFKIPLF